MVPKLQAEIIHFTYALTIVGNGTSNLSLIRKASLNILSKFKEKGSIKAKRLRLAISGPKWDNLLEKILMR